MYEWDECLKTCYRTSYGDEHYVAVDAGVLQKAHDAHKEALGRLPGVTQGHRLELECLADVDPVFSEPKFPI